MENGAKKDALFKGLWIADKSPALLTKELPILSLDFSTLNLEEGGQELKKSLHKALKKIAVTKNLPVDEDEPLPNFVTSLVSELAQTTKEKKVVILIDEVRNPNFSFKRS